MVSYMDAVCDFLLEKVWQHSVTYEYVGCSVTSGRRTYFETSKGIWFRMQANVGITTRMAFPCT